jgi:outer membrane protein OmpA-like peptidoglycan-associated protein
MSVRRPQVLVRAASSLPIVFGLISLVVLVAGGAFWYQRHQRTGESVQNSGEASSTLPTTLSDGSDPSLPAAPAPDLAPPPPAKADNTPITDVVRTEVLKRIDALPHISSSQKDRLYNGVHRARDMHRVIVVSFSSSQQTLPATEKENVKKLLSSAEIMKYRNDPIAVFVILGFGDARADERTNAILSANRAKSVRDFMATACGVTNVTHEVPMGGAKLVDEKNVPKSRIVEIWAVLP